MTKKKPMTTKGKVFLIIGIVLGSLVLLAGLALGGLYWFVGAISDPVEVVPEYPVVFGVRADGDHVLLSTGRECPKGTGFDISLPYTSKENLVPRFEHMVARQAVTVIDLTDPGPQMKVDYRYPDTAEVELNNYETIEITVDLPHGPDPFFSSLSYANLQERSMNHPDQFYYGEMGWLTPDDVAARDGVDLLTICTPRPK